MKLKYKKETGSRGVFPCFLFFFPSIHKSKGGVRVGTRSIRKGKRAEYEVLGLLRDAGVEAERVPVSGASRGFKGDIWMRMDGKVYKGEVKRRKDEFKKIYKWLEGKDMLFLRDDYKDWLVVFTLDSFLDIVTSLMNREVDLIDFAPDPDF